MRQYKYFVIALLFVSCDPVNNQKGTANSEYNEPHRPQIHFSPKKSWMNDPNGMVYFNQTYHLFFQYYPDSTVWGPMHWGHAVSNNLVHWIEHPIALYPDSLGYIFSGSAVVDVNNTSGFGKDDKIPLVAIFTYHDPKSEREGRNDYQSQSIAYSLDEGKTWTKYVNNPVVKNPGIRDFRDPKVMWFEEGKKWVMTLATKDRITFYSSKNLKEWTKESEFGEKVGAHGGVWECPDLFYLDHQGEKVWVLLVSINPGGPNQGSATQYFTGKFDGKIFIPFQTDTRWIDFGPDNYAGVTWSNTGDRKIFLGWMSNWQYANLVPTDSWRSAMTIARDLGIQKVGDRFMLTSKPVVELQLLNEKETVLDNIDASDFDLSSKTGKMEGPARLRFHSGNIESFTITLSNDVNEKLIVGFDKSTNQYFIDRSESGNISFEKGFGVKHYAPRISQSENLDMEIFIDNASIEIFADEGLSVMTAIFFPGKIYSDIRIQSPDGFKINAMQFNRLKNAWKEISLN